MRKAGIRKRMSYIIGSLFCIFVFWGVVGIISGSVAIGLVGETHSLPKLVWIGLTSLPTLVLDSEELFLIAGLGFAILVSIGLMVPVVTSFRYLLGNENYREKRDRKGEIGERLAIDLYRPKLESEGFNHFLTPKEYKDFSSKAKS